MVITGLFGATAMGALFGTLSLSVNTWRWLFILNILSALLCLIVGYFGLPRNEVHDQQKAMDKTGGFYTVL